MKSGIRRDVHITGSDITLGGGGFSPLQQNFTVGFLNLGFGSVAAFGDATSTHVEVAPAGVTRYLVQYEIMSDVDGKLVTIVEYKATGVDGVVRTSSPSFLGVKRDKFDLNEINGMLQDITKGFQITKVRNSDGATAQTINIYVRYIDVAN